MRTKTKKNGYIRNFILYCLSHIMYHFYTKSKYCHLVIKKQQNIFLNRLKPVYKNQNRSCINYFLSNIELV